MSTTFDIRGGLRSDALGKPSVTTKQAIYTLTEKAQVACLSLRATNSSGGNVTIQLHFYDTSKSTEAEIYPVTTINDGSVSVIDLSQLVLDPNDELRATVGTGNALDLVFTYSIRRGGM